MNKKVEIAIKGILIIITILSLVYLINCIEGREEQMEIYTYSEQIVEKSYEDDNNLPIGLYYNGGGKRTRVKEITRSWELNKDIIILGTFLTEDESMTSSLFQYNWNEYYNRFSNIQKYKIGYEISFKTKDGGIIRETILRPANIVEVYKYIQVYLYDDIHQRAYSWYSHVTDEEYNSDTILSSIKLTGCTNISEIIPPIKLTAFTYNGEDDFDENGSYRGNCSVSTYIYKY